MKISETASVIEFLSLTDNRKITEDGIKAWHELIGHLDADVARRAAAMAKQDEKIDWVEPKHIVGKARIVLERMDIEERRARLGEPLVKSVGVPMPLCEHGRGLVHCRLCCLAIAEKNRA